jgi:hypothetical protein
MDTSERAAKQDLLLLALGKCASIKQACEVAGIDRKTFYRWKASSKTFARDVEITSEEANDTVDDEIVRRAIEGIEEPLVSMGNVIYEEELVYDVYGKPELDAKGRQKTQRGAKIMHKKYSDGLLLALAKSRMKKYRDREDLDLLEQLNKQTGGTITLNTKDMTSEELTELKQIGQNIKAREEKRV